MEIGILTFSRRFLKESGSSVWRGDWLIDKWPEEDNIEIYKEGKKYDVVILQKVYEPELVDRLDCIKILDICDPEWITNPDKWPIQEIADKVDAIVTSSQGLYDILDQILYDRKCELIWIDDRVNFDYVNNIKKNHTDEKAKKAFWFGFSGNGNKALPSALMTLKDNNMELLVMADKPVTFIGYEDIITNVKWSWEMFPFELLKCDFVLNPPILSPLAKYKSLNKTYLAWAFGMPVAHTGNELRKLIESEYRKQEAERCYTECFEKHNVEISVKQYKDLINKICNNKK